MADASWEQRVARKGRRLPSPSKYFVSRADPLTDAEVKKRAARIKEGRGTESGDPSAYRPFDTDRSPSTGLTRKTKPSSHTAKFWSRMEALTGKPKAMLMEEWKAGERDGLIKMITKLTGIPAKELRVVYDKGMAAWRTGHRPGASQVAWARARVFSFVNKGTTYHTADAAEARRSRLASPKAAKFWKQQIAAFLAEIGLA